MNMSFKLGKVVIPVSEEKDLKVTIEGLEVSVSDSDLKEGLMVVKALPGIMKEIKSVMEESAPSAKGKVEEVEEDGDFGLGALINQLKKDGKVVEEMNHPLFGKGLVLKMPKGKHPLEKFFEGGIDLGTLGKMLDKEI